MIMYLNYHGVHACICFKYQIFVKNDKFSMKCAENCDKSGEGASRNFLDMLIDHCNLF